MKNFKLLKGILLLNIAFILLMCGEHKVDERSYPVLNTRVVSGVNESGANLNGEILNVGASGIIDHGFIYSLRTANPTFEESERISLGETNNTGSFSAFANRNLIKDEIYYVRAYAVARQGGTVVYGQVVDFVSEGGSQPEIESLSRLDGVIGDTITVVGFGFSNIPANNKVYLGDVFAEKIVKANSDSLSFLVEKLVPLGENELSITVGDYTIKAEDKFTLKPASITSFSPAFVSYSDTITVNGLNFPARAELAEVTVLGKPANVISVSPAQLKAVISTDITQSESLIDLRAGVQQRTSSNTIKVYAPIITGFSPGKATKGTLITVTGNYFNPVAAHNIVKIGDKTCLVEQASKTSLTLQIPSGIAPGQHPIEITIINQTAISIGMVEIIKPVIANISPMEATWGGIITISGENFGPTVGDNKVTFDNVQANILMASETEIKVHVPNNLLKASSLITVQAGDNLSTTFEDPFTLSPPSITSFTPGEGKSNSTVTISGHNFNPIAANNVVKFGDLVVPVVSASLTQLTVTLPTSLIDSEVLIEVLIAEQSAVSTSTFHIISPWKKIPDYPGGVKYKAAAFSIDEYGYVTLGTQTALSFDKPCWRYSPTTNDWFQVRSFSLGGEGALASYVNQSAFTVDGVAYVGLGITGSSPPREKLMRYSPINNNWVERANFGGGARESAVGLGINGFGYIITGRNQSNQLDVQTWQYDPVLNTWARKADFPPSGRTEAAGFSIGNNAYLTTGIGSSISSDHFNNDLWEYNTQLNQWRQLESIPGTTRAYACAFSIGDKGYVIGGSNSSFYFKDFWRYNVETNTWTRMEDFPGSARADAVVFVVNGKAYYGTGVGSTGALKDFWEFDPSKL